ncbi:MAG: sugar ABC transporter permease [Anaerolineae bacterium]|nr:sugar ABC transporter permease [Anaerolineae bacterium]MDW8099758.1 sugar ABC transporter permease [Anaerolineae bacterium]
MTVVARKRGHLLRSQHAFAAASLTPIMLYMMAFTLLPMIWAVLITLYRYSPTRQGGFLGLGGGNPFIGLGNYLELFSDSPSGQLFRIAVKNTFIFALLVLPLNLSITLPLAVLIESIHERLKTIFRTIYFLPTVTSLVAVSLVWGVIYNPTFGLLNLILRSFGLKGMAWLSDPQTTVLGVALPMLCLIVTYVWQDMGYNLVIFIAGLQSIPDVFHEAARVDGANAWQRFRHITLPLLRPTLTFVIVMTMLSSWQVFVIFYVMTRGGPGNATRTLVLHIYETAFRYQEMGLAATMAMALFAMILVTTLIQLRLLRKEWEY